ncbi:MAG: hypothetical protein Q4G30_01560 [Actinomycetaceae bacterium]|nr:hypothetical protein [Actinomycetaceae bacterium]
MPDKEVKWDLEEFLIAPGDKEFQGAASKEHVKAWLAYKAGTLTCECGNTVDDPDNTEQAHDFYKGVFPGLNLTKARNDRRWVSTTSDYGDVQGDWMCSVWTTYRWGLEWLCGKQWKNLKDDLEKEYPDKRYAPEDFCGEILTRCDLFSKLHKNKLLQEFIREACTLANFVIVPDGMNRNRNFQTFDRWDVTLDLFWKQKDKKVSISGRNTSLDGADLSRRFRALVDSGCLFQTAWLRQQGRVTHPLFGDSCGVASKPKNEEQWFTLVKEMTRRIRCRRKAMECFLAGVPLTEPKDCPPAGSSTSKKINNK